MTIALLALTMPPASHAGPAVIDDLGKRVELTTPARRVIPLYSGLGEIVSAMGLSERLIARTNAEDWPPQALSRPPIGTHMRPNLELVVGLGPDLVLQLAGRDAGVLAVENIRRHGIPVAVFAIHDFGSLFSAMERIGVLLGAEAEARREIEAIQARLAAVDTALTGLERRPGVFFEVRYPNLLAAGQGSMVSEIIRRAGGENVVTDGKKLVRLSEEALIGLNPEVYLVQRGPMNPAPVPPDRRGHFRTLAAVRAGRVLEVDEAVFSRPGPRSVLAVEKLAAFLHPQRFPQPATDGHDK